jgi:aspartyl-tRNA(Asn)/glutamyl-tRNA(Gln) amidotransferase subunit B
LRCDANISLRKKGIKELGVKTELKNMNSFKAVRDALAFEIERQTELLGRGEFNIQETRLWDAETQKTISMRTKEEAQDYRYFPEPDLTPFIIEDKKIEEIRKTIPELPEEKLQRFKRDYALTDYDAKILVLSKKDADYAEKCMKIFSDKNKKSVVNWLIGPLASLASDHNCSISEFQIPPGNLVELIDLVEKEQKISHLTGKSVLADMVETKKSARVIIEEKNLAQISDTASLEAIADEVIKKNAKSVADFKAGKENALMFLVGQVMKKSQGKANPKVAQELLKRRLENA